MLTRLIGSFVIVGIAVAFVLIVVGFGDGAELTYGNTTVTDPPPWQICCMLLVIGVTLVPPWWALQRAMADNHRVRWRGGG
ncbi:hypothetical protein [Rubripirellula lacrimiformis]|nr:hypothetical protein [Rubripirellula lacrimiformis]